MFSEIATVLLLGTQYWHWTSLWRSWWPTQVSVLSQINGKLQFLSVGVNVKEILPHPEKKHQVLHPEKEQPKALHITGPHGISKINIAQVH